MSAVCTEDGETHVVYHSRLYCKVCMRQGLASRSDMPIPRRMKRRQTTPAPDKAAEFRTFPKTASSANHDILNFLASGSSSTAERNPLGPIAMTSSRWRLLCPRCCHLLLSILSAFLQCVPRLPRLSSPCRQPLANQRRPSSLLESVSVCRSRPSSFNSTTTGR
jgi:hypothetical protein